MDTRAAPAFCDFSSAAAADAALIDGHSWLNTRSVSATTAAAADAALIDGHPINQAPNINIGEPQRPTRP